MFSSIFFLFGAMFCRFNLFSWGLSLMFLTGFALKSVPLYLVTFLEVGSLSWSWGLTLLSLISILLITYVPGHPFITTSQYWMFLMSALLLISLIVCFNVNNMIFFYTFFELSALIIFLMVLSLGYQPERLEASLYLLLFTVFTSLPFFGVILILSVESGLVEFTLLKNNSNSGLFPESGLFSLMLIVGVLTKFPMYFVHIWLPKAHVEASTTGSMLLAGVLLKLGSFGLGRLLGMLSLTSLPQFFAFFALVGGALISMLCVRMTDLKMLVAYSSVAHMSLVITGMLSLSFLGQVGGLAMSISHGITSSALFFGVGSLYSQSNSRLSLLNSGCGVWAPSFTFFWFIFCCSNMGTPPSLNFWAEVILLFSIVSSSVLSMTGLGISLFFAVAFNMIMYSMSQSQKEVSALSLSLNFTLKDQGVFLAHLIWLLLLTFFLDIMFKYSENSNTAKKYLNQPSFLSALIYVLT